MRWKPLVAVGLLTLSGAVHAVVNVENDRFTQRTTVTLTAKPGLAPNLKLWGAAVNGSVSLGVSTVHQGGWSYLNCHSLHWLLDGKPQPVPEAVHNGQVLHEGYVFEIVINVPLTTEQLKAFSAAQVVEYKVCNSEHRLVAAEIAELKKYINTIFDNPDVLVTK